MIGCPWWGPSSKEVIFEGSLEIEFEDTLPVLKVVSVFMGF